MGFLLVLVPEVAAIDEALFFHERLRAAGIGLTGFVANRIHLRAGPGRGGARSRRRCAPSHRRRRSPAATIDDAAARLAAVAHAFAALSASERRELGRLGARAPGVRITEVPLLDHDVDNLAELRVVGEHLSPAAACRRLPAVERRLERGRRAASGGAEEQRDRFARGA